jgi:WD40 repeat protein
MSPADPIRPHPAAPVDNTAAASGGTTSPNADLEREAAGVCGDASQLSAGGTDFGFGRPTQSDPDPLLGLDLGGVTIRTLIGAGGMGRVYKGWQAAPGRSVAVKVMRPGLASDEFFRRFDHEARLLARLQHPGIAQIFLVGVHRLPAGEVPFFVLEYLAEAVSITEAARRDSLDTRTRIRLFRQACAAVGHGHERGVIHRDLKPGNILVDAAGRLKVIDFGVARSTDADAALTTLETDAGRILGTLQYMSPEQFAAGADEAGVRSDVYALGVVLFELLADRLPYDVRRRPLAEAARIVQETPAPSLRSIDRSVPRDLAVIVAKCLEKDPARRYASVHELDTDLGRHLAGEPIQAAPPTFLESVGRLARRHRAAAIAAAAILTAIIVAAGGVLAFAIRAEQARTVAETQREQARQSLYVANLVGIAAKRDRQELAVARALVDETRDLLPPGSPEPIELRAAAASLDEALVVFSGHTEAVESVAFSPAGETVLTGSGDRTARLWKTATGRELIRFEGHGGIVTGVAFAPNGDLIATAATDGCLRFWISAGGRPQRVVDNLGKGFLAIAWEPGGQAVLVGNREGQLWRIALDHAAAPELLADAGAAIRGIAAASPDVLAVATDRGGLVIRAGDAARVLLTGHRNRVNAISLSGDGTRVATASSDCSFRLWNAGTGQPVLAWGGETLFDSVERDLRRTDRHHVRAVNAVAFSPDGQLLATASSDMTAGLWDAGSGREVRRFIGHTDFIRAVSFSSDSRYVLTGSRDGTARLWNASSTDGLADLEEPARFVRGLVFSPDGNRLVTLASGRQAAVWNPDTCERVALLDGPHLSVAAAAFDQTGHRLALGFADGQVRVREMVTGRLLHELPPRNEAVTGLAFTADGSRLLVGTSDGTLSCSAFDGGDTPVWTTSGEGEGPCFLHLVAEGRQVLGLNGHSVAAWDTATGRLIEGLPDMEPASILAVSRDGRLAAAGLAVGGVRVWQVADGKPVGMLDEHRPAIGSLAFSPDGTRLVVGDKTALWDHGTRIWDLATGKEIAVLRGQRFGIKATAYSPRGRCLVTGSSLPRVWGPSNAEIHAARLEAAAIRQQLEPLVAGWLETSPNAAVALQAARPDLSPAEYRLAADMLLAASVQSTIPGAKAVAVPEVSPP